MLRDAHVTFSGIELPHKLLETFGSTTVVVPQPYDETLACGGLIALLHRAKQPVSIVIVNDGGNAQRKSEVTAAAHELGVTANDVQFLDYPDGDVSKELVASFPAVVKHVRSALEQLEPKTLVIPFRGDSCSGHTATWHMVRAAVRQMKRTPRVLEYPVWIGPLTEALFDEFQPTVWKLDISTVLARKQRAVLAYRSQISEENLARGYEAFFEFPG